MNEFCAVLKREFKGYFATPVAYVFLVIFLFFCGYLTFYREHFFEIGQADLRSFFVNIPLLFAFMVPATAMRLWAEERRSGSIELLFSLPITVTQAVLGKFFAAWSFIAVALILTSTLAATVFYLGDPDGGVIFTGYIGAFFVAGVFLAVGSFFSALSKNQVISFILSVVACAILVFFGMPTTLNYLSSFLPAGMLSVFETMSLQVHFESMQKGVIKFTDVAYFVILTIGWVAATAVILEERKAA
jgi:ABC-2 type transport system permease protein